MLAAGANAIVQPGATLNSFLLYASGQFLVRWNRETDIVDAVLGDCKSAITCIVSDDERNLVVVGTQGGQIYQWKESLTLLEELPKSVTCLCSTDDGFVAGCSDGNIYVYPGARRLELKPGFYPLCIDYADKTLAIGGTSNSILIFYDWELQAELPGHDNWVRSLAFREDPIHNLVLASASQDKFIRLWQLTLTKSETPKHIDDSEILATKKHYAGPWTIEFEALLMGHDDWVVSLDWSIRGGKLLSASSDSSLIVWQQDSSDGMWIPYKRVGDISIMGASTATGATGGFWTAKWLFDNQLIATVSRSGSWRLWDSSSYEPLPGPTGHRKSVTDVAWMPNGTLLSTSLDQTTRLWLPRKGLKEVGRPQIHGYDMITVAALDDTMFVSGGDEKALRVFTMPQPVATYLKSIKITGLEGDSLPQSAAQPALGLSNKTGQDSDGGDNDTGPVLTPGEFLREDQLQRSTLWPETEKLFGHGFELISVACSTKYIVSSCKALSGTHAVIRVYDRKTWRQVCTLGHHQLTITRLSFSPSQRHLLSVSRDRSWALYDMETLKMVHEMPKAHSRIIWDAAFLDDYTFVTVSRDKSIKLWSSDDDNVCMLRSTTADAAITACTANVSKIVLGLENGRLLVFDKDLEKLPDLDVCSVPGRVNRISLLGNELAVASDGALTTVTLDR